MTSRRTAANGPIPYREDPSNRKDAYERNFVRNRIVPLLETLNPRFQEKVLLLLADIASVNSLFDRRGGSAPRRGVPR